MRIFLYFLFLISTSVLAQTTELIIPFGAGGPTDIFARYAHKYIAKTTNRNLVALNKPGADGRIAMDYFKQNASASLIVASTGTFVFNKVQYSNINYDVNDYEVFAPVVVNPILIGVSAKGNIKNMRDFINVSRTKPLTCGIAAASSLFAAKFIQKSLNLNLILVPYKGVGDVLVAVMGNNLDCIIDSGFVQAHIDGRIRIIASADDVKNSALDDADLLKDHIPGYTQFSWWGFAWSKNSLVDWRTILSGLYMDAEFTEAMRRLHYRVVSPSKNPAVFLSQEYERYERMRVSLAIDKEHQ